MTADSSLRDSSFCFCVFFQMKLADPRALGYIPESQGPHFLGGQDHHVGGGMLTFTVGHKCQSHVQESPQGVGVFTQGSSAQWGRGGALRTGKDLAGSPV